MKKFLISLLIFIGNLSVNAQTYYYRTFQFAYKQTNWSNWTDWQNSDMLVTINFNSDVVTIYSPTTQVYRITQYVRNYTDNSGGKQAEFRFIDQDNDRGTMRLRIERNGNSQMYIEFADVIWVYNLRRISR